MNHNYQAQRALRAAVTVTDHLKPFSEHKDPATAAVCGFFAGGIGLGLYFRSWGDFVLPIVLWVACTMVALPTLGTSYVAAGFFCAAYGYRRAKASNEKLRKQRAETVIDVEPSPVIRVQPPPLPAFRPVLAQQVQPPPLPQQYQMHEQLTQLAAWREQRLISDTDYEAKKQEILARL
jgi:hypothetical protein